MLPIHSPSARRWTNLRSAVMRIGHLLAEYELVRRALHRRALGGPPEGVRLDLLRERHVPLGDAARCVRLQLDPELPPGDLEVGMVVGRLAEEADGVDQHQRGRPAVRAVLAAQPAVLELPTGKLLLQTNRDLLVRDDR